MARVRIDKQLRDIAAGDWWRQARSMVRPYCGADPALHRGLRRRFEEHWKALIEQVWTPMLGRAKQSDLLPGLKRDFGDDLWARMLLAKSFEVVYVWSEEREAETTPGDAARDAADSLTSLDTEIGEALLIAAELLDKRHGLMEAAGIRSSWTQPGLDVWEAIDTAERCYPSWHRAAADRLQWLLVESRSRSGPRATIADLLQAIAGSVISLPVASFEDDAASINLPSGAGHNNPAEWMRRFFAAYDEAINPGGPPGSALSLFTDAGLSQLLGIASAKPDYFTFDRVKDNRQRYTNPEKKKRAKRAQVS